MKKVLLMGELGKKFGEEHNFDIKSPAEAIRALCVNFPEFKQHLIDSEKDGVAYKVITDDEEMPSINEIHNPFSRKVYIVPVIGGAKKGFFNILLGAALIAASFYLPTTPLIAGIASSSVASMSFGIGLSLALGGVAQLLSPTTKKSSGTTDEKASYYFNGATNSTLQGDAIPIGYGRMKVGSKVISAGVAVNEYTANA